MAQTSSYLLEDAVLARETRNEYFQAGFDYLDRNAIKGRLNDKRWRFYWNINLYIDTTAACNGKCRFCINNVNFTREDIPDDDYVKNLRAALGRIRFLDPSVQIVGGEPTIRTKRLYAIMELLKEFNVRKPILGTNGSGLCSAKMLDRASSAFQYINISRHHYDDDRLRQIMAFENPLNNARLESIAQNHPAGRKLRLNCCLLDGHIDSFSSLCDYLVWALRIGIKNVCFSTLSALPSDYIYQDEFIDFSRRNTVDFNAIMREVTQDPRFQFVKFHTGSHCMYEVWDFTGAGRSCTVVFATSNNHFAQLLDDSDDLIEQLVFHTDGTLAGSWNRNCKVI